MASVIGLVGTLDQRVGVPCGRFDLKACFVRPTYLTVSGHVLSSYIPCAPARPE